MQIINIGSAEEGELLRHFRKLPTVQRENVLRHAEALALALESKRRPRPKPSLRLMK
jgi:hypothetical protein